MIKLFSHCFHIFSRISNRKLFPVVHQDLVHQQLTWPDRRGPVSTGSSQLWNPVLQHTASANHARALGAQQQNHHPRQNGILPNLRGNILIWGYCCPVLHVFSPCLTWLHYVKVNRTVLYSHIDNASERGNTPPPAKKKTTTTNKPENNWGR